MGIDKLTEMLIDGQTQTAIAAKLKVSKATLIAWIAADPDRSARVREARIAAASTYAENAAEGLRAAADPFALAKAKELAHHLRWQASKADPRSYGDKLEIDSRTTFTDLTDEALDAKLAMLEAKRLAADKGNDDAIAG
ncbi:hypothetical protein V9L20_01105 [Variovorax sp. CCNWLW225]|uniref:terminase small subunit-like protein n=1 Tax=Variovorax sp. CCNWLW225 TaxID=3127462 RepID=UPI003077D5F2